LPWSEDDAGALMLLERLMMKRLKKRLGRSPSLNGQEGVSPSNSFPNILPNDHKLPQVDSHLEQHRTLH